MNHSVLGTYVALLRGINVGGHKAVSMADLKVCFEKSGYSNVQTYINSGNVIFNSPATDPRTLETTIERALTAQFGHQITVVVRNFAQMQQLMRQIPASWQKRTDQKCNVIFLRHTIDNPATFKDLPLKPGIEELHYHPGVVFWSAKTSDLTKSTMLKVSRMPIYQDMTVRGLPTAHKIYKLMKASKQSL